MRNRIAELPAVRLLIVATAAFILLRGTVFDEGGFGAAVVTIGYLLILPFLCFVVVRRDWTHRNLTGTLPVVKWVLMGLAATAFAVRLLVVDVLTENAAVETLSEVLLFGSLIALAAVVIHGKRQSGRRGQASSSASTS
jgi:hypothetical protein